MRATTSRKRIAEATIDDEDVGVVELLGEADARCDQARDGEQPETQRREPRAQSTRGSSSVRIDGCSAAAPQSR